jgi:hypothetical protein
MELHTCDLGGVTPQSLADFRPLPAGIVANSQARVKLSDCRSISLGALEVSSDAGLSPNRWMGTAMWLPAHGEAVGATIVFTPSCQAGSACLGFGACMVRRPGFRDDVALAWFNSRRNPWRGGEPFCLGSFCSGSRHGQVPSAFRSRASKQARSKSMFELSPRNLVFWHWPPANCEHLARHHLGSDQVDGARHSNFSDGFLLLYKSRGD